MSISGVGSATGSYMQGAAPDGDSAAVEAKESASTKASEQLNGGKSGSKSGSSQAANSQVLNQIKAYANQHMPASEIAQRLGVSVSAVMQQASAAGINLNANTANPSASSASSAKNPDIGNNVDTTV